MRITLNHNCLETGVNLHLFHHFLHVRICAEVLKRKSVPETGSRCIGHMIHLHRPTLVVQTAAQIDHTDVEHRIAVTEIAQVNEIGCTHAVFLGEDSVTELQVTVNSGVSVRGCRNEITQFLFLLSRKIGISIQHVIETVFDVLKLGCIYMHRMQFLAHLRELTSVFRCFLGIVATCARIGFLTIDTAEADSHLLAVCHQVTRFGCRNTHIIHFLRQLQFERSRLEIAEVHLHHDRRIRLMVITCTVGAFAGAYIVVQIN